MGIAEKKCAPGVCNSEYTLALPCIHVFDASLSNQKFSFSSVVQIEMLENYAG